MDKVPLGFDSFSFQQESNIPHYISRSPFILVEQKTAERRSFIYDLVLSLQII